MVEVPIACTYDLKVAGTKYFHALEDGEIPLLWSSCWRQGGGSGAV
ncbi:MAG TPA: DUF6084 family protein [Chloroflexota bacterium]|nr:DUF6084 family protein [Chloroflexota bacterium]